MHGLDEVPDRPGNAAGEQHPHQQGSGQPERADGGNSPLQRVQRLQGLVIGALDERIQGLRQMRFDRNGERQKSLGACLQSSTSTPRRISSICAAWQPGRARTGSWLRLMTTTATRCSTSVERASPGPATAARISPTSASSFRQALRLHVPVRIRAQTTLRADKHRARLLVPPRRHERQTVRDRRTEQRPRTSPSSSPTRQFGCPPLRGRSRTLVRNEPENQVLGHWEHLSP